MIQAHSFQITTAHSYTTAYGFEILGNSYPQLSKGNLIKNNT